MNGNWAVWSSWGICSASCGGGMRSRVRICSDPAPQNGGRLCVGSNEQIDNCNTDHCSGKFYSVKMYQTAACFFLFSIN